MKKLIIIAVLITVSIGALQAQISPTSLDKPVANYRDTTHISYDFIKSTINGNIEKYAALSDSVKNILVNYFIFLYCSYNILAIYCYDPQNIKTDTEAVLRLWHKRDGVCAHAALFKSYILRKYGIKIRTVSNRIHAQNEVWNENKKEWELKESGPLYFIPDGLKMSPKTPDMYDGKDPKVSYTEGPWVVID